MPKRSLQNQTTYLAIKYATTYSFSVVEATMHVYFCEIQQIGA
jgi:hypothetical protein